MNTQMGCHRVDGLNYAHARTTPGAMNIDVIDEITGRCVRNVVEVDCVKGWICVYASNERGGLLINPLTHMPIEVYRMGKFRLQETGS